MFFVISRINSRSVIDYVHDNHVRHHNILTDMQLLWLMNARRSSSWTASTMILLTLLGVGALAEPQLQVLLDGQEVEGATLSEEEGAFQVSLPESLRAMQKAGGADQARLEIILDGVSTGSYPLRQLEHLFSESEPPQSIGTARLKTHALLREGCVLIPHDDSHAECMLCAPLQKIHVGR